MPCPSGAERELAQWRTLLEAVAHVCAADGCDLHDARRQLRKALTDGALSPLRWEDARPTPMVGDAMVPVDMPPGRDPAWETVEIDWLAGTVRDDRGEAGPRHRVPLIQGLRLKKHWPEMHPPADWDDPERYEAQGARLARKTREESEAYDAARNAVWEAECGKPIECRQWFRLGDLADELAQDPRILAINEGMRVRIMEDLTTRVGRQEFDMAAGEVATLGGNPPSFVPLTPLSPRAILSDPDSTALRRDAAERFVRAHRELPNAAALMGRWFNPAASKLKSSREPQRPSADILDEWMAKNVGIGVKRDPTIADCRDATGATVRAAIEAWRRVPADRRRRRGRPPKK
jgi:hypothetical protein